MYVFPNSYVDPSPNIFLCASAQAYYSTNSIPTQVVPASLTNTAQCLSLAGAKHLTLAPSLIKELSDTTTDHEVAQETRSLFLDNDYHQLAMSECRFDHAKKLCSDEAIFRMAVTRNKNGENEAKMIHVSVPHFLRLVKSSGWKTSHATLNSPLCSITKAINFFCDMQTKLEELVEPYCGKWSHGQPS